MIFVSGGTGLLGSHVLIEVSKKGLSIRAGYRTEANIAFVKSLFAYHNLREAFEKIHWIDFDLSNPASVESAVEGCKEVYHCAALVSFFSNDSQKLFDVNVTGTRHMVNASLRHGVKKFCHVSSTGSIGRQKSGLLVTEKEKWSSKVGNSVYSKTKHLSELEIWRASEEGLNAVVVNPSIILGPALEARSSAAIIKNASKGGRFFTSGSNGFVDVRDAALCMVKLMEANCFYERFLLVGHNKRFREMLGTLAKAFGKKAPNRSLPRLIGEVAWRLEILRSFFAGSKPLLTRETIDSAYHEVSYSNEKVRSRLSFEFRSLEDTVDYAVASFQKLL